MFLRVSNFHASKIEVLMATIKGSLSCENRVEPSPSNVGIHPSASPVAVVHEKEIVSPWSFCAYFRRFGLGAQEWGNLEEIGQCPRFEHLFSACSSFTFFFKMVIMDPWLIGTPQVSRFRRLLKKATRAKNKKLQRMKDYAVKIGWPLPKVESF